MDDLFIVTSQGCFPPEGKPEHPLIDAKAETLEIRMIDFGGGRQAAGSAKAAMASFDSAVTFLSAQLGKALRTGTRPRPDEATTSRFLQEIKDYSQQKRAGLA